MSETTEDFVWVLPEDATEDQKPGKVPAKALDHWKSKGFVEVDRAGKRVGPASDESESVTAEDDSDDATATELAGIEAAELAQEPVDAALGASEAGQDTQTPDGTSAAPEDGTAADSADDTSTDSEPKTTGRAGRAR